jgi:hypothetical protein
MEEKIKAILKKIDTEYDAVYDKAMWCNEHNFKLDAIALHEQAKAIGKIGIMIKEEFDIE